MTPAGVRRARGRHPRAPARHPRSEAGCRRRARSRRTTTGSPASTPRSKATSTTTAADRTPAPLSVRRRQGRRRQDHVRRRHRALRRRCADAARSSSRPIPRPRSATRSNMRLEPRAPPRSAAAAASWTPSKSTPPRRSSGGWRPAAQSSNGSRCAAPGSTTRTSRVFCAVVAGHRRARGLLEIARLAARRPIRFDRRGHRADRPHASHARRCRSTLRRDGERVRRDAGEASRGGRGACAAAGLRTRGRIHRRNALESGGRSRAAPRSGATGAFLGHAPRADGGRGNR